MLDFAAASSAKPLIFLIDSNGKHVEALTNVLSPYFTVEGRSNSQTAMADMVITPPAVAIINERVSPWGVFPLLDAIKSHPRLSQVAIIGSSETAGSDFFALAHARGITETLKKPFDVSMLIQAINRQLSRRAESAWQAIEPVQKSALLETVNTFNSLTDSLINGAPLPSYQSISGSCAPLVTAVRNNRYKDMLKGVQLHDNYTYVHSLRVATFLTLFGIKIGIRNNDLMTLATGGLMHDIGKSSIPFEVLNKPGKLAGAEWEIMKGHVERSREILEKSPDIPKAVIVIATQHHEKLNGKGYPQGLRDGELNDLARMATIVDIFGALTDKRVYKPPMAPEEALLIMSGMHDELDMHLLGMFREMLLEAARTQMAA